MESERWEMVCEVWGVGVMCVMTTEEVGNAKGDVRKEQHTL